MIYCECVVLELELTVIQYASRGMEYTEGWGDERTSVAHAVMLMEGTL